MIRQIVRRIGLIWGLNISVVGKRRLFLGRIQAKLHQVSRLPRDEPTSSLVQERFGTVLLYCAYWPSQKVEVSPVGQWVCFMMSILSHDTVPRQVIGGAQNLRASGGEADIASNCSNESPLTSYQQVVFRAHQGSPAFKGQMVSRDICSIVSGSSQKTLRWFPIGAALNTIQGQDPFFWIFFWDPEQTVDRVQCRKIFSRSLVGSPTTNYSIHNIIWSVVYIVHGASTIVTQTEYALLLGFIGLMVVIVLCQLYYVLCLSRRRRIISGIARFTVSQTALSLILQQRSFLINREN